LVSDPDPDLAAIEYRHHETMAVLRARHPVTWVPALGGWVVSSRDLAVEVMRDAATYTVDDPRFSTAQVVGESMLSLDGAEHQRHRTPFAEPLRPAEATARYGAAIRTLADDLVAKLRPAGRAELRRELAGPLAVSVSAMVLGLRHDDTAALLAVYDRIVAAVNDVSNGGDVGADGRAAFGALADELRAVIGVAGTLVHEVARSLAVNEVVSNAAVFLFGGIETSEGMTTNAVHHLLADSEQWAMVVRDPSLVDVAVEESLRLEPAAARVDRYATRDVDLAGARIHAGDLVVVSLAGANRDPSVYVDPDRFDLLRTNARTHVAFAHGPHACIGAQLARLQTRAAVLALIEQIPAIRLEDAAPATGAIFRKPAYLRVAWRPVE
jgi:cytochrome P450